MTLPLTLPTTLPESYRLCEQIARTRARNFYFSFLALPRPKRRAMCAVYAFLRYCDDLADDENIEDRAAQLGKWRASLRALGSGDTSAHPMMPAFLDTVNRYDIPLEYFEEVINGAEMDLSVHSYATFEELYRYCYRVASVVGLTCLKVFGYTSEEAPLLGEKCGIAFQLTNIIRDVREDGQTGRIYLPAEDLDRFGVRPAELSSARPLPAAVPLLAFEANRAQQYYEESLPLLALVDRDSQCALSAMICIYHGLLRRIRNRQFDVFTERVSLPVGQKLAFAARSWLRPEPTLRAEVLAGREDGAPATRQR
ncbi:MAG: phytoene/squalene synthase family protein [Chloroflexi bacterium]|nr:phytoene/squalene synthase family protein [Chloroflexota bacterium]